MTLRPDLRSPKERPLFLIGVAFSGLVWLCLIVSLFGILYAALFAVFGYAALALALARIRSDGIRVSAQQLPDLYARCEDAAQHLGMREVPAVYVIQAGGVLNAFATRLLSRSFVVLHAEVIERSHDPKQVDFILAHEFGHLAAGHLAWRTFLMPYMMVPWLGPAYSRACEYTCDRCGLSFVSAEEPAVRGLLLLSVGALAPQVNVDAWIEQRAETEGFWSGIYELVSTHPFLTKRAAALRAVNTPGTHSANRHPLSYVFAPFFGIAAGTPAAVGMIVVIYLGVLAAVAIPAFSRYVKRAKTAEATQNITALYEAEISAYERAPTEGFASAPPTPAAPPTGAMYPAQPSEWATPAWQTLGFSIASGHYYQYSIQGNSQGFTVRAIGDLDGDGTFSTFERSAHLNAQGDLQSTPIEVRDELE